MTRAARSVMVAFELPTEHAYALAELTKRMGWADCREISVDEDELRAQLAALGVLRLALEARGIVVR